MRFVFDSELIKRVLDGQVDGVAVSILGKRRPQVPLDGCPADLE